MASVVKTVIAARTIFKSSDLKSGPDLMDPPAAPLGVGV
jgi:hypothetical protein